MDSFVFIMPSFSSILLLSSLFFLHLSSKPFTAISRRKANNISRINKTKRSPGCAFVIEQGKKDGKDISLTFLTAESKVRYIGHMYTVINMENGFLPLRTIIRKASKIKNAPASHNLSLPPEIDKERDSISE